jgi:hypothetical protein
MKKAAYILISIAGLLLLTGVVAIGQNSDPDTSSKDLSSGIVREKVFLFSDRSLYAVHENIIFKIEYLIENNIHNEPWSTVVYVELIRQDGHSLAQCKLQLVKNKAEGNILIPGDLPSGIYFLKAYTKWMRNFPPESYEYKPIKIVNPFSDKTESEKIPETSVQSGKWLTPSVDSVFRCITDKAGYTKREKVTLTVSLKKGVVFNQEAIISVSKKGANDFIVKYPGTTIPFTLPAGNPEYFPEPRGISISGKVIDKETRKEVPYATVHLAMLNKNSFYSGNITGERGEFLFTFPMLKGASDFYMEADKDKQPLTLQIDNEYCIKPFAPTVIPFELTGKEKETAREICVNMQIGKMSVKVHQADTSAVNLKIVKANSFYGDPVKVIYTQKYVKLTNIHEFFFELVPEFYVEYKNKLPIMRLSKITTLASYPPLCLIDNIPVTDVDKFLNVPVEKIERIELVDKAYITGNIQYNGIIHAFSKNRDLAGIALSKNSVFFRYNLYSDNKIFNIKDYSDQRSFDRIPDRRNTLYWNPGMKLKQGQEQKISFSTADLKGEYEILIQGLSASGDKIILGKGSFTVN